MEPSVLVVMERASTWPSSLPHWCKNCVALQQEPSEAYRDLLRRTHDGVRTIERAGGHIELAVLSCNDDASAAALEGRIPVARTLLATVLHAASGKLLLLGRASAPDRLRHSLVALAGTLTEALAGSSASVSALFSGSSPAVRAIRVAAPRNP